MQRLDVKSEHTHTQHDEIAIILYLRLLELNVPEDVFIILTQPVLKIKFIFI